MTTADTIDGVVEARNERGIRLDGEWLNRSKFGPHLELPDVGARVRAEVDGKGFLRSVEMFEGNGDTGASITVADHTSTRLVELAAAARLAADRADIKSSDDVLRIAESWLAWVESMTDEPAPPVGSPKLLDWLEAHGVHRVPPDHPVYQSGVIIRIPNDPLRCAGATRSSWVPT